MAPAQHTLHSGTRIWPESNCYVDLWIGALHAHALDPVPMLVCAIAPQFDIDQWTFCKPTASEIAALYAVRVEELNIWRTTREQVETHVRAGRLVLVEVDAFHLPDTAGVSYKLAHQKTTIGIDSVDVAAGSLTYFHNAGHFALDPMHTAALWTSGVTESALPAFAEFADFDRQIARDAPALARIAATCAAQRLATRTDRSPFVAWGDCAEQQVTELARRDIAYFHAWAFATLRQAGAMAELSGVWCRWMHAHANAAHRNAAYTRAADLHAPASDQWLVAAGALESIAQTLAAQQFRLARVASRSSVSTSVDGFRAATAQCATQWDIAQHNMQAAMTTAIPPSDPC